MHKRLGNFAFVQKRAPPNGNFAFVYKRAFVHKRAAPPPAGDHGPEITIAGNRGRKITKAFVHKRLGNQGVFVAWSPLADPRVALDRSPLADRVFLRCSPLDDSFLAP